MVLLQIQTEITKEAFHLIKHYEIFSSRSCLKNLEYVQLRFPIYIYGCLFVMSQTPKLKKVASRQRLNVFSEVRQLHLQRSHLFTILYINKYSME